MSRLAEGIAAHQAGDLIGARAAYEAVLAAEPAHAQALQLWGTVALQEGRFGEALQALQHAVGLDPEAAEAWEHLGLVQRMLGEAGAAESLERAVALAPDRGSAWSNLALVHVEAGRIAAAVHAAEQAVAHAPGLADAHTNLALARKESGDLAGAAAAYRAALVLDATAVAAWSGLAETGQGTREEAAALQGLLDGGGVPGEASGWFALGHLLDPFDPAAAFAAFARANALRAAQVGPFDPDALARSVRGVEALSAAALTKEGGDDDGLVFVVGLPRSGTTLVERVLAAHPEVVGAGEVPVMPQLAMPWEQEVDFPAILPPREWLQEAAQAYRAWLPPRAGARWVVDKQPDTWAHLWLVARLFPKARVVHVVRDPCDVAWSCFTRDFAQPRPWAQGLDGLVAVRRAHDRVMAHYRRVLPLPVHTVRYEALVRGPAAEVRRLLGFLDLPWHDGCVTLEGGGYQRSLDAGQRGLGVHAGRVGRWRRYAAWLGALDEAFPAR